MSKRGLSTIVATLIIILLVLVAVGLIWVVVRNVIQDSSEQVSLGRFTLDLSIEQVQISENQASVKLKRNAGDGDFIALKFIVDDGENSEIVEYNVSMKQLEQKTFVLNLLLVNGSRIKRIQVVPVFRLDSGREIIGDVKDEYIVENVLITTNTCSTNSDCDDNNAGTTNACVSGVCQYTAITECIDGDNFCPSGCTSSNDNDCVACTTNSECNDNNAGTTDTCVSGTCQNTAITTCTGGDSFCPTGCYSGDDSDCTNECALNSHCNDNNAGTTDSCSNGACVYTSITCTGSSTQSCTIPNGQGQQTRTCTNGQWGSWGTCNVVSCNSGYTQSGNSCVSTGGGNVYYVSTTGSSSGDGSINNPWDLDTAFGERICDDERDKNCRSNVVGPGSTIYLRGGIYESRKSYLDGDLNNPIIVRPYPGEWVTMDVSSKKILQGGTYQIDPNFEDFEILGSNAWFYDLEVTAFDTITLGRGSAHKGQPSTYGPGPEVMARGVKLINVISHNTGMGFSAWTNLEDVPNEPEVEIYGGISFGNGWFNSQPTTGRKTFGHGAYLQNFPDDGPTRIIDTIFFNNVDHGWQVYTQTPNRISNFYFEGNDMINGRTTVQRGSNTGKDYTFIDNLWWDSDFTAGVLQYQRNYILRDNEIFWGGASFDNIENYIELSGNNNYYRGGNPYHAIRNTQFNANRPTLWDLPWKNHNVYGAGARFTNDFLQTNDPNHVRERITAADFASRVGGGEVTVHENLPTTPLIRVRDNHHDPERFRVTIVRFQGENSITVNIPSGLLSNGEKYFVINALDPVQQGPSQSGWKYVSQGNYNGNSITFDLTGHTIAGINGAVDGYCNNYGSCNDAFGINVKPYDDDIFVFIVMTETGTLD